MQKRLVGGLAAGIVGVLLPVSAMASSTATDTLSLAAGTLSISGLGNWTSASTAVSAGTLNSGTNSGTWTDQTGLGLGWNGTLAMESFLYTGTWTQTSGTVTALGTTAAGSYTGTSPNAFITVTVNGTPSSSSTPYTYSDNESGTVTSNSGTATNGSATTLANGITITFAAATTYPVGAVYSEKMGVLPTTALALHSASGTITNQAGTLGGSNLPTFTNNGVTVSSTSATAYGTAVKFITANALQGIGSFTVVPGVTITWDANNTWAANYVANAQYTIASGP
jgi:hypothetical protein